MGENVASAIIVFTVVAGGIAAGLLFGGEPDIADALRCKLMKDAGIQCVITPADPRAKDAGYNNHSKKYGRLI